MCSTVTFVLFLLRVLDATWGQELSNEKVTDETLAEQWLQELDGNWAQKLYDNTLASWNYDTNITEENGLLSYEAYLRLALYSEEACKNASRFAWKNFTDASLKRRFGVVTTGCTSLPEDEITELYDLGTNMTTIYNNAKICRDTSGTASDNGTCINVRGLVNLTANSRDWNELLWAWKGWRDASGKKMKPLYNKFVLLLNKGAKLEGHRDYGDSWRRAYETDDFSSAFEELWKQLKPLYQQLHGYVRRKLMDTYPQNLRDFPSTRQIPAHILGNIWAQSWDSIRDLVDPFPNSSIIDVTKILKDQGFTPRRMFQEADAFFISLGLPAMPEEFWNHSLLEYPTDGREVDCHPSAFNFFNGRDFRIKMCAIANSQFLSTIHHEMGHIQYYMSYKNQPFLFQQEANPGFGEAIGDVIALSVMTPEHLRKINLLNDTTDNYESEINFLMKQALEIVAFLPYGYLIDRWRWEVFDGTITPQKRNKKYWKLRCGLQGVSPPVPRSEDDFDPGAKSHVPENYPYIGYFVSSILQFQFHKSLCDAAGHVGPLHKCDIYNSTAAGDKLRKMLSMGSSKPWPDAMEVMTGQRKMDAGPLLDYFRPLQQWLENENKGQDVTWDELCPCGSIL